MVVAVLMVRIGESMEEAAVVETEMAAMSQIARKENYSLEVWGSDTIKKIHADMVWCFELTHISVHVLYLYTT